MQIPSCYCTSKNNSQEENSNIKNCETNFKTPKIKGILVFALVKFSLHCLASNKPKEDIPPGAGLKNVLS